MTDRLALLDGLIYADGFGCALTVDELWRYSAAPVSRDELQRCLREDGPVRELVCERDGLYSLANRTELIAQRPARIRRARRLQRRARRVARVLRHVPYVRGLLLTGSTAADDAREDADVDMLVVVAPGRLGTVFVVLGSVSRLLGRRPFCPNYYVCEGHLAVVPENLYMAHEIAQATALVGAADALRQANPWITARLPNAGAATAPKAAFPGGGVLQRLLELPLRGKLGEQLERRARTLAEARLQAHYEAHGEPVPPRTLETLRDGTALSFHRGRQHERVLDRHDMLRARLEAELESRVSRAR
jgi:predicted nucleotidyltransferase